MVKETFSRKKPSYADLPPPGIELSNLQVSSDGDAVDQAEVSLIGTMDSSFKVCVYATGPLGLGVMRPPKSRFALIAAQDPVLDPIRFTFETEYGTRFGGLSVGAKVFCRFVAIDTVTGASFQLGMLSTIVAAA